jgi:hypothetical protein
MTPPSLPGDVLGLRRIGPVPWYHNGCRGLSITAGTDVPTFDDSMIRLALVRGAETCDTIDSLDRALNRELWPLGYVARLEPGMADGAIVLVKVASGR